MIEKSTLPNFKFFPQLNDIENTDWLNSRHNINKTMLSHFQSDSLQDKFVRAIAEDSIIPIKEVLECGEFFHRIRKQTRHKVIADLCCGHG
ncbi:MAG: hypothetical protein HRT88_16020, partial [Lentisphaeraceae bacterium]|nr:hypothetical protein [Lentisphaeraceae bacterium]